MIENLYAKHYNGPKTSPEELATYLVALFLHPGALPELAGSDPTHVNIMNELCWGMKCFSLATPTAIDFAWGAISLLVKRLKAEAQDLAPDQFDPHDFAVTEIKEWVDQFLTGSACHMTGETHNDVRDNDSSILSITPNEWEASPQQQLLNLEENRRARRETIVDKVILARALRDGYVKSLPISTTFMGREQLIYIEQAFQRTERTGKWYVDDYNQTGCDVIAAMFLLRACARTLLDRLPRRGYEFHSSDKIPNVAFGQKGKVERVGGWKRALTEFVVGEKAAKRDFAFMAYAGLALENLQAPRDETSAELFSFDKMVF